MNLHGIVRGAITRVNPDISVTWRQSTGPVDAADYSRTPGYVDSTVQAQIQPLSGSAIERLNNLGFQGVMRRAHMYGDVQGMVRSLEKGGDLVVFGGQTWKVVQVLETWPDWCAVAICLQ